LHSAIVETNGKAGQIQREVKEKAGDDFTRTGQGCRQCINRKSRKRSKVEVSFL